MSKEKRFSVSIAYHKQTKTGLETSLRVLITDAINEDHALGKAINEFKDEMENHHVTNIVVLNIYKE